MFSNVYSIFEAHYLEDIGISNVEKCQLLRKITRVWSLYKILADYKLLESCICLLNRFMMNFIFGLHFVMNSAVQFLKLNVQKFWKYQLEMIMQMGLLFLFQDLGIAKQKIIFLLP